MEPNNGQLLTKKKEKKTVGLETFISYSVYSVCIAMRTTLSYLLSIELF